MRKVIMLIGAPGSGKSTLAKKLEKLGFKRFNADQIRGELYGDEAIQGDWFKVWDTFNTRLENCLMKEDCNVVIDNTNTRARDRRVLKDQVKLLSDAKLEFWFIDVSLEICLNRNRERPRNAPEDVVKTMHNRLEEHKKQGLLSDVDLVIGSEGLDERSLRERLGLPQGE